MEITIIRISRSTTRRGWSTSGISHWADHTRPGNFALKNTLYLFYIRLMHSVSTPKALQTSHSSYSTRFGVEEPIGRHIPQSQMANPRELPALIELPCDQRKSNHFWYGPNIWRSVRITDSLVAKHLYGTHLWEVRSTLNGGENGYSVLNWEVDFTGCLLNSHESQLNSHTDKTFW